MKGEIGITDVWQESPLGFWTAPVYKASSSSFPAKQSVIVGSSSGFKLLQDWSYFDLPKLIPVEHISLMPASWLSLTNTWQQVTHPSSSDQELRTPAHAEMNKEGALIAGVPYPLSPIPSPFPFLPIPYPSQRPLRRLTFYCKPLGFPECMSVLLFVNWWVKGF